MTTYHPKNNPSPNPEEAVAGLVALAQETLADEPPSVHEEGLVRFERAVARRTLRRRGPLGSGSTLGWTLALGVATAAIVLSLMTFRDRNSSLTFSVVNGTVGSGGYVRANVAGDTSVHFSDGSSLALPDVPLPFHDSSRSGSVGSIRTWPTAALSRSPSSSAQSSGGDLTSVRETSTVGIEPGIRRTRGESFRSESSRSARRRSDD